MVLFIVLLGLVGCSGEPEDPAAANLAGQLVVIEQRAYPDFRLSRIDVETDRSTPIFDVPQSGWINQFDIAPDGQTLALSYAPPPAEGDLPFERIGLFLLSLSEAEAQPQPLLVPTEANTFHYNPVWSMDSRYLFYVSYSPQADNPGIFTVALMRYELGTGETIKIADDGIWPRISPNNQYLTYIAVNPDTLERGLVVSDLDGEEATELLPIGAFFDIDTPLFSGDNRWVYFTATPEDTSGQASSFLDWLLGIRPAYAHTNHNVPSAWWRIPVSGGAPEKLTAESEIIIYGYFDEAGQQLYFSTLTGIYTIKADGSGQQTIRQGDYHRLLAWMP